MRPNKHIMRPNKHIIRTCSTFLKRKRHSHIYKVYKQSVYSQYCKAGDEYRRMGVRCSYHSEDGI